MPSQMMPLRQLGKNGPSVAAIGFGTMNMSIPSYGKIESDKEKLFATFDRALELGSTFWDTSDLYGDGESLIGEWFKRTGKRDQVFLATKFGFVKRDDPLKPEVDSSGAYAKEACMTSLAKLGVDSIDLYYLHHANSATPIEETMRALVELKTEGKIKYIGLSNVTSSTLRRAYKIHPVAALQIEYSPFTLDIENESGTNLLQACRELGVAVVCYSPLGRGLLTTAFREGRFGLDSTDLRSKVFPRLQLANREANMKIVDSFAKIAAEHGCSVSQLAIAWLLKQGDDIFPNPGTKTVKYLEENSAAAEIIISDEDEQRIRALVKENAMVGDQLPAQYKSMVFTDTRQENAGEV